MLPFALQLPSGLYIQDAVASLKKKFAQWPWENYDGDPPSDPNKIEAADIDRANRLGARANREVYEGLMDTHGPEIQRLLMGLPMTPMEDTDICASRREIVQLFNLVLSVKKVGIAGATKWPYPFRPSFLAVIDRFIENYYWWSASIRSEARFRQLQRALRKSRGDHVFELLALLRDDISGTKDCIDNVIRGCSGLPYANVSRVRVVESLIWYYYARGGPTLESEPAA